MKIDYFTFITKNSSDYAELLMQSCKKFQSNKHTINWKAIQSCTSFFPKKWELAATPPIVRTNNHARAMEEALKFITEDYVIFSDADIVLLYPGWDQVIVNMLDQYDAFGIDYPPSTTRYRDFPTVRFFCFRSEILKKIKLNFQSCKIIEGESANRGIMQDEAEAYYFNKRIGERITYDTGWKLPIQLKEAKLTSKALSCITSSSPFAQLPFVKEKERIRFIHSRYSWYMCEWHYERELFLTHLQASRKHPLHLANYGRIWMKRINAYTNKKFGFDLCTLKELETKDE